MCVLTLRSISLEYAVTRRHAFSKGVNATLTEYTGARPRIATFIQLYCHFYIIVYVYMCIKSETLIKLLGPTTTCTLYMNNVSSKTNFEYEARQC
jgi:hypothetical protein